LRNFEPLINKVMENTIAYFGLKDEDDYMYKKGEAKTEARLEVKIAAARAEAEKKALHGHPLARYEYLDGGANYESL
jgi:hypothetical protein